MEELFLPGECVSDPVVRHLFVLFVLMLIYSGHNKEFIAFN